MQDLRNAPKQAVDDPYKWLGRRTSVQRMAHFETVQRAYCSFIQLKGWTPLVASRKGIYLAMLVE